MQKTILEVPQGVKFISEWQGYSIPEGHTIVDKGICGCGYTHWCLTNNDPVILCSPRKLLLQNKFEQIDGLYYFKNEKEAIIEFDASGMDKAEIKKINDISKTLDIAEREDYISKLKKQLTRWLVSKTTPLTSDYGVPKILVTYDSLKHVLDVTKKFKLKWKIVIDEFQSIFGDATFKADVEIDFLEYLHDCPDVCYLSATPMLEKYLDQIDDFKNLPYYEIVWPKSLTSTIKINRKYTNSLVSTCKENIGKYKTGVFPKYIDRDGNEFYSKEIVFFINSVKTICDIIRSSELGPQECNIICAESSGNLKKIKNLGRGFGYGRIPKRGEPNKMFTFCTRTAYLGADFYSDNASTIICSNINIKTLMLDISLDLPQIMGRQRLDSNPWKNECLLLYTGASKKETEFSYEEFTQYLMDKNSKSEELLDLYDKAIGRQKLTYANKLKNDKNLYQDDYVGISKKSGMPIKNYLVQISELRSWEISRPEYQDSICIKKELADDEFEINEILKDNPEDDRLLIQLNSELSRNNNFQDNMKTVCEFIFTFPEYYETNYRQLSIIIPNKLLNYINTIGPERIKANGYIEADIQREVSDLKLIKTINLSDVFQVGKKYLLTDIKSTLQQIYSDNNITKKAKASDISYWFNIKDVKILTQDKKQSRGYQILSLKTN